MQPDSVWDEECTALKSQVQQPSHCLLLSQTEFRLSAYNQFHSLLQNTSSPHIQSSVKFSPCTDFKSPACTVMENALTPQPPPNAYWPNQTSCAQRANSTKTRCNFQGPEKGESTVKKAASFLHCWSLFQLGERPWSSCSWKRNFRREPHIGLPQSTHSLSQLLL